MESHCVYIRSESFHVESFVGRKSTITVCVSPTASVNGVRCPTTASPRSPKSDNETFTGTAPLLIISNESAVSPAQDRRAPKFKFPDDVDMPMESFDPVSGII